MFNKFVIACLLLPCILSAAVDVCHPLTMGELVGIALENNPQTRQAWWNAKRAAAVLGESKSGYYPKIDFDAGIVHGRDFKFTNGPDVNYTTANADFLLSMLLLDGGERSANVLAAKMALIAADWQNNWVLQNVMVDVLDNAYQLLHAQESLKAALASVEDAQKMLEISQGLNHAGLSPISDVYTSSSTLAQMKMKAAKIRAQLDIRRAELAATLGLCPETCLQLAISDCDEVPLAQCQNTQQLIVLAKQQRADLIAKRANLSESYALLDKARSAYGPKLFLSGRGGSDHDIHDKAHGAHYKIGLNLEIPIFTGFEATYQKRRAYANTQITSAELFQLELDIILEVMTYSRTLEAAQEMLSYAEDNLNFAVRAYEGVLEKYRSGKQSIAEVSNAQLDLAQARLTFSEVKTEWLVARANLAYATGSLSPYRESYSCKR